MVNNRVLQSLRLPARLTVDEAGALLGFHPDSIRFLVKVGLLNPLGETEEVQVFFATLYIRRLCNDEKWLVKATNAVRAQNRARNAAQKSRRLSKGCGLTSGSNPE
jgi:hypothetical protein